MSLLAIILIIVALLLGASIGIFAGISYRKNVAEMEFGSAEEEARKIVSEAMKTAEAKEKEVVLEGKDEVHRFRTESEKEIADRRRAAQRIASSRAAAFILAHSTLTPPPAEATVLKAENR